MKSSMLGWGVAATLAVGMVAGGVVVPAVLAQGGQAPAAPQVIAFPQQPCTLTPQQVADGRKVALQFFQQGVDRVALADPTYKQHNPAFKKRAEVAGVSDFEEFKNAFGGGGRQGGGGGGRGPGGPGGGGQQATPPGPNNQTEIVTTECDTTVVVHRAWRQDPETPGRWFEAYTFDAFRVRNGKLVEHWDTAVINPPAAGGQGAPGGAPAGGGAPARGN